VTLGLMAVTMTTILYIMMNMAGESEGDHQKPLAHQVRRLQVIQTLITFLLIHQL